MVEDIEERKKDAYEVLGGIVDLLEMGFRSGKTHKPMLAHGVGNFVFFSTSSVQSDTPLEDLRLLRKFFDDELGLHSEIRYSDNYNHGIKAPGRGDLLLDVRQEGFIEKLEIARIIVREAITNTEADESYSVFEQKVRSGKSQCR